MLFKNIFVRHVHPNHLYTHHLVLFLLFQADGEKEEGEAEAAGGSKAQLTPPPQPVPDPRCHQCCAVKA